MCNQSHPNNTSNDNNKTTTTTTTREFQPIGKPAWISTSTYNIIMLILSAITYSISGLFLKLASSTGVPPTESVFVRASFQGIFVTFFMTRINSGDDDDDPRNNKALIHSPFGSTSPMQKLILARGALGGLAFVMYYYTMNALPLGDAMTLLSLTPVGTMLVARIFLGEEWSVIAAFCSVLGAVLIARPSCLFGSDDNNGQAGGTAAVDPWGYVTAVMGVLIASFIFVLVRKAGKLGVHTLQLLFSFSLFGMFFSSMFGLFMHMIRDTSPTWTIPTSKLSLWYLIWMSFFGSWAHLLWNYVGRHVPAGLSSIAKSSDIMWSYLIQVWVFGQVPTVLTCVGVVLVVASILMIAFRNVEELSGSSPPPLEGQSLIQDNESADGSDVDVGYVRMDTEGEST